MVTVHFTVSNVSIEMILFVEMNRNCQSGIISIEQTTLKQAIEVYNKTFITTKNRVSICLVAIALNI